MEDQKEAKVRLFEENYEKFVKKCLQDNIFPTMRIRYDTVGIFPLLDFYIVSEEEKKEILSSLNKKQ